MTSSGGIQGCVRDADGGPLPDAEVILRRTVEMARAVTDTEGGFHLQDLSPGHYELLVLKHGFAQVTQAVTVVEGRQSRMILGLWDRCCRMTGLVRDATTSLPIPFATVKMMASGLRLLTLRCDGDGCYETSGLGAGRYILTASAAGFSHESSAIVAAQDHCVSADLKLMPFVGNLAGTVINEKGMPLAGVIVRAFDRLGILVAAAFTDRAGVFALTDLGEDSYTLALAALGHQNAYTGTIVSSETTTRVRIVLLPDFGIIEGQVIADGTGQALCGAVVRLLSQDDVLCAEIPTDAHGRFYAPGLVAGSYKALATADGFAVGWMGAVVVNRQTTEILIRLTDTAGRLTGMVNTPDGQAIGAAVTIFTALGLAVASQITDMEGRFELAALRPGRYHLRAIWPGYVSRAVDFAILQRQTTQIQLELGIAASSLAGGIASDGRPVGGVVLRVIDTMGRSLGTALSDPDGCYLLQDLPAGEMRAIFSAPDLTTAAVPVSLQENRRLDLHVEMGRHSSTVLKLFADSNRVMLTGTEVRITDSSGDYLFNAVTNAEGFFWIRAWPSEAPPPEQWQWQVG